MLRSSLLLVLSLLASGAAHAAGFSLQPHRAVYDLSLREAREGSGVEQLTGRLVLEMARDCEGYVLNQRILTRMFNTDGMEVLNDFSVSTWENLEGTLFRFNLRNQVNGELVEEVDGRAQLNGPNGAGEAVFNKPEESKLTLPAGTIFPFEHTLRLLKTAASGKDNLGVPVFDGSGDDGLYHTFSVIGGPGPVAMAPQPGGDLLAGERSWNVRLAYFPYWTDRKGAADLPEFEIGFLMYENGIAGDLVLDYGNFALNGRLTTLQALPKPQC